MYVWIPTHHFPYRLRIRVFLLVFLHKNNFKQTKNSDRGTRIKCATTAFILKASQKKTFTFFFLTLNY